MKGTIQNRIEKTGTGKNNQPWSLVIYTIDKKSVSTFNADFKNFKTGDLVEYESETDGKYETIKTIKLVGEGDLSQFKHEHEEPIVDTQRLIVRQNSLTNANAFVANVLKQMEIGAVAKDNLRPLTQISLTEMAKTFEDWSMRE